MYGTNIKYGGEFGFQLQRATYKLDDDGVKISMELGQERPAVTETVRALLFRTEQLEEARA